jgi:selenocysteine-specific elongation factor
MRVIGTAGHIDHGKSSLVRVLTGIDPDRLPEEKARGMTLDLGFAWLDLGGESPAGIVDVPGHERLVKHMVAGAGGIDVALLVIAADEVVMPQTREHLAILDLLEVQLGVVALTKCDLVDQEWLDLAVAEVQDVLQGTSLAGSTVVPCSSTTGAGMDEVRRALRIAVEQAPARPDRGQPHLPVDRVFSRSGYGTIVTGTLLDGYLAVGQEIELVPEGPRGRIRGLQSYQRSLDRVGPGRRVAVNLAGVTQDAISRGMVLCRPGSIQAAGFFDLRLRAVGGSDRRKRRAAESTPAITHNMAVTVHTGAAEVSGRVRLLDAAALEPGGSGWAQIRLDTPLAVQRGDRVILRVPSPPATVGGGAVLAVNPPRHRRHAAAVLERLAAQAVATPAERLADVLARGPITMPESIVRAELSAIAGLQACAELARAGQIMPLQAGQDSTAISTLLAGMPALPDPATAEKWIAGLKGYWTTPAWLDAMAERARTLLHAYHARYPLRRGMPVEELRTTFGLDRRVWSDLLGFWRSREVVATESELAWAPGHSVRLSPAQREAARPLLEALAAQPFSPPSPRELPTLDPEILASLLEEGDPVALSDDVLLRRQAYTTMRNTALAIIDQAGYVTVAMLRDQLGTSRKFTQALLEHLDDLHITRRIGDRHLRGPATLASSALGD